MRKREKNREWQSDNGTGPFQSDKWRVREPNIRKSRDLEWSSPLSSSYSLTFPFPDLLCPSVHRIRWDLLFSRDVNHTTDVLVCTRGLTRSRQREKKGCRRRQSVTETGVIAGRVAQRVARDRGTRTICISHERNNRCHFTYPLSISFFLFFFRAFYLFLPLLSLFLSLQLRQTKLRDRF